MRIAFYAPLKAPDHPVPSGDRQMARLLLRALNLAGFATEVVSTLRTFTSDPEPQAFAPVLRAAEEEKARLTDAWRMGEKPDLWFTYHPYYKAPDLLGPDLARHLAIPYVTAEASYAGKRDRQGWAARQALVRDAISLARLNLCFTGRDRAGLAKAVPEARLAMLPPFIDTHPFADGFADAPPARLMSVAMMRKGDKFASFAMLAKALERLLDLPWRLTVIGDGPVRAETIALFAGIPAERLDWRGEMAPENVPAALAGGGLYVWPGAGEAYGIAYLEAQAAGLPVVAQETAGVPAVVRDGETGLLTPEGDVDAYAAAVRALLTDHARREAYGRAARAFVLEERSLTRAAQRLASLLAEARA
ncbi:MAG: glycosyltransferase family 4 protein [Pseudomonadota bacterium]